MAVSSSEHVTSLQAAADNRTKQYHIAKVSGAHAFTFATAGDRPVGILQNDPNTGEAGAIMLGGISRCVSDGSGTAIVAGDPVKSDGSGRAIKAATDKDKAVGYALDGSSAAGIIISVLVNPFDIAV